MRTSLKCILLYLSYLVNTDDVLRFPFLRKVMPSNGLLVTVNALHVFLAKLKDVCTFVEVGILPSAHLHQGPAGSNAAFAAPD